MPQVELIFDVEPEHDAPDELRCGSYPFDVPIKAQSVTVAWREPGAAESEQEQTYLLVTAPTAGMNWLVDPGSPGDPMVACYGCDALSAVRRMVDVLFKIGAAAESPPAELPPVREPGPNLSGWPAPVTGNLPTIDSMPECTAVSHGDTFVRQQSTGATIFNIYCSPTGIYYKIRV